MTRHLSALASDIDLPKGINRAWNLPDEGLDALWQSIKVPTQLKTQLLSQSVLNFSTRRRVSRSIIPLHGLIMMTGLPGTGKTSLARGLAHRTAKAFPQHNFRLLEVEPHSLTSSAMGKTQRAVSELFSQSVAEAAGSGNVIVLLDEVETLAADRSKMSLEANPVDIHRATDAVLVQLDALADRHPNLLFVATSNFPQAVDTAFTSRCDLVLEIPLPNREACEDILQDCLNGLGAIFPAIGRLAKSPDLARVVSECVGLDGRAIRKMVANAMAANTDIAMNPQLLDMPALLQAAKSAKANRGMGRPRP